MRNPWDTISTPSKDVNALRIDSNHGLDFFWAKDYLNKYMMIFEYSSDSNKEIENTPELYGIDIVLSKISTQSFRLILILKDKTDWQMFYSLCSDLLSATNDKNSIEQVLSIIYTRLRRWQNFLKKRQSGILTEEKIKGLMGELIFLKDFISKKYGISNAITYWIGPEGAPQDFNVNDIAIEVKSQLGTSHPSIKISSLEQLETQLSKLYLFVVTLGKSDENQPLSMNLNKLVNEIEYLLEKDSVNNIDKFRDLLLDSGYVYNEKYNKFSYILSQCNLYEVKENFPRIISEYLQNGVTKVTYNINLQTCLPYKLNIEDWSY